MSALERAAQSRARAGESARRALDLRESPSRLADDAGQLSAHRHRVVGLRVLGASMWGTLDAGHSVSVQTRMRAAVCTRAVPYGEHRVGLRPAATIDRLARSSLSAPSDLPADPSLA